MNNLTVQNAIVTFQRIRLQGLSSETKRWYNCRLSLIGQALGEMRPLADVQEIDHKGKRGYINSKFCK